MSNDQFSEQSTSVLLNNIQVEDASSDYIYEATEALLKRWRQGIDLDALIDLLQSKLSSDRIRGAYYLGELGHEVQGLNAVAIGLANDAIPDCQRAFVSYIVNSRCYDETIANALAKCLVGWNLPLRLAVIRWAIRISEERFKDFSVVAQDESNHREFRSRNPLVKEFWKDMSLRRAVRGLKIIQRIREGDDIQQIRNDIPEEDSFVFDNFLFWSKRQEFYAKWLENLRKSVQ